MLSLIQCGCLLMILLKLERKNIGSKFTHLCSILGPRGALVNMSANWSFEITKLVEIILSSIFLRIKWQLISMCFSSSGITELYTMHIAVWLSQNISFSVIFQILTRVTARPPNFTYLQGHSSILCFEPHFASYFFKRFTFRHLIRCSCTRTTC